jgi:NADH-quinone oxidoreductase subunit N
MVSSIITMLFASFAAMYQKKIKRFLAYSSINHVGYMLMGISTGTLVGLHSFFFYILIYLVMLFGFFSLVLSLRKQHAGVSIIYLTDFFYLRKSSVILKFLFVLIFFSLAGIPPLVGFFSKFYLFFSAVEASYYILPVVGVLSSVLSTFYYIRCIKIINFEKIFCNSHLEKINNLNIYLVIFFVLLLLLFCFSPNFLFVESYHLCLIA